MSYGTAPVGEETNRLSYLVHRLQEGTVDREPAEVEARRLIEDQKNCAKAAAAWVALQKLPWPNEELVPAYILSMVHRERDARRAIAALHILDEAFDVLGTVLEPQGQPPVDLDIEGATRILGRLPSEAKSAHLVARLYARRKGGIIEGIIKRAPPETLRALFGVDSYGLAVDQIATILAGPPPVQARATLSGRIPAAPTTRPAAGQRVARPTKYDRYLALLASPNREERRRTLANMFDHLKGVPEEYQGAFAAAFIAMMDGPDDDVRRAAIQQARGLSWFVSGEPRLALARRLWKELSAPDRRGAAIAAVSLAYYIRELPAQQRDAVIDALLEPREPRDFREHWAWIALHQMGDGLPEGRVTAVFHAAGEELRAKGNYAHQDAEVVFRKLVPRLLPNAPEWVVDWVLFLFGETTNRYGASHGSHQLRELRNQIPAWLRPKIIAAMLHFAGSRPPDVGTPFLEVERCQGALLVLAAFYEWLDLQTREWLHQRVTAQILVDDLRWRVHWRYVLSDLRPHLPYGYAAAMFDKLVRDAEDVSARYRAIDEECAAPLISRMAPEQRAAFLPRVEALASQTADVPLATSAGKVVALLKGEAPNVRERPL